MKKYLKLLKLCLKAKKNGHDCFLYYSPHVNSIKITVYINGWKKDADIDKEFRFYINNYNDEGLAVADQAIKYLKNLIKESEDKNVQRITS